VLLDQPHTADVRTLEESEFYVADAQAMLAGDPTVALYVAGILARRLDVTNRSLIEVKHSASPRVAIRVSASSYAMRAGPDFNFYSAACCNAVSDPRTRQWAKTDATRNPTVQWPRRAAHHHCVGATSVYLNQEPFGLHAAWKKSGLSISDGCHSQPFSNKSGWLCEGAAGRGCVIL
jgi:hypothetical protein